MDFSQSNMMIPKGLREKFKSPEEVEKAISEGKLVQRGVQTFADLMVAENWGREAASREEHPFIVLRRALRNELYQPK